MSSHGFSRRTLLRGAALAGGAVVLGGLVRAPIAFAAGETLPRLATLGRGYPAALDTGRALIAFGIGPGGKAYHRWMPAGGGWFDWVEVPNSPVLKARPIPLLNANGAMSLFVTDTDGKIWTGWQSGENAMQWSWQKLDGPAFVEEPFPVLNTNNAMSLFARATDGLVHHTYQDGPGGPWKPWAAFPAGSQGRPWTVIGPSGGMVVFARGAGGGVVHRWQSAAGGLFSPGWTTIPGANAVNEDVTAVVNPTGAITVFAGSVNGIAFTWQTAAGGGWLGEWREWTEHRILGRPSVLVGPTGGMALFAKRAGAEAENILIHRSQPSWGANWSGWDQLEPITTGEPSGILGGDGRLSAFARTKDGWMVHRSQANPGGVWPGRTVFDGHELKVG